MTFEEKVYSLVDSCDRKALFKLYAVLQELNDSRTALQLADKAFKAVENRCLLHINGVRIK